MVVFALVSKLNSARGDHGAFWIVPEPKMMLVPGQSSLVPPRIPTYMRGGDNAVWQPSGAMLTPKNVSGVADIVGSAM